ncbi:hypothetical protein HHK36_023107 [Tetracentron sinense]|uniref:Helicase C-terminal domain-containing protein n=1 Tax=Tetracentron sinense TaxID=13715 RepID=A0A835D539_TETSI|nr:hypothetical protein HHK36_023107 [Tetracentron sinense]
MVFKREEIRFMIERDGSAKGIVFSQFKSFLDLMNYSLDKSGINCLKLVGSMTMSARDDAMRKFTVDPNYKIILMSLKAGGVALNLTVASHVFLMDPCWNPAVERQAQDRIHRIGQYNPIRTMRFLIENTVEEWILKLQEEKELVFEGFCGGSRKINGERLEILREEIRFMIERDGSAKGIVFSQFKSFLDLMNYSLDKSGINCLKLVGSMTMSARDDAIRSFTVDPNYKIILMSLKAGGVALNLAVASHVRKLLPCGELRKLCCLCYRSDKSSVSQDPPCNGSHLWHLSLSLHFLLVLPSGHKSSTLPQRILKLQAKKELVFEG